MAKKTVPSYEEYMKNNGSPPKKPANKKPEESKNRAVVPTYEDYMKNVEKKELIFPKEIQFATARKGNVTLELYGGNYCNIVGFDILLSKHHKVCGIDQKLKDAGVETELNNSIIQGNEEFYNPGQFIYTTQGNLVNSKAIFHMSLPQVLDQNQRSAYENSLVNSVYNIVQICASNNCFSLLMPSYPLEIESLSLETIVMSHYAAVFNASNLFNNMQFKFGFCLSTDTELKAFYEFMRDNFTAFDSVQFYEDI